MDMTMIDITGIPDVKEGDEVVVFGKQLSVSQLARMVANDPLRDPDKRFRSG